MKIKKVDELFAECESKAYQCIITYCQNRGLRIKIYTKYNSTNGNEISNLYEDDWCKNSKKLVKKALKWTKTKDDFRKKREGRC
ncbi:hypothetical protein [Sulfurimonas sp.]|uniref:hypothetical protein n=1 Tax=Sulfurimonas sp. TaxID=2022749 RepID=UPI0025F53C19|nr:hypothetical protein [Sulfurimonas sp.]